MRQAQQRVADAGAPLEKAVTVRAPLLVDRPRAGALCAPDNLSRIPQRSPLQVRTPQSLAGRE